MAAPLQKPLTNPKPFRLCLLFPKGTQNTNITHTPPCGKPAAPTVEHGEPEMADTAAVLG